MTKPSGHGIGWGDGKDEGRQPLRHSYTNRTLGDGATVVKRYHAPGALARLRK